MPRQGLRKKIRSARNSSCGKFTANIFSLHGRIRVKTLGIYSSVLTLENLLVLSCPQIAFTVLQRNVDVAPLRNRMAIVKRSLRRDPIFLWTFLTARPLLPGFDFTKIFSAIYAKRQLQTICEIIAFPEKYTCLSEKKIQFVSLL